MLIATLPPLVRHRQEIIDHPLVDQLRFNTIMPIGEDEKQVVENMIKELLKACRNKPLWLDLKARQLRITQFAYLPYAFVEISQKISVNLPTKIYFKECVSEIVKIVDGNKLILSERPMRVVGKGEPVNILDPSLVIHGFLTQNDIWSVEAFRALNQHRYLLSFTEIEKDIQDLLALDPQAIIGAKIESQKGLQFVQEVYPKYKDKVRLMAALDDLYINMGKDKIRIYDALKLIIEQDPQAIAASRIMTSLEKDEVVSMSDLSQLRILSSMGYSSFLLSDGLCFSREAFHRVMANLGQYFNRFGKGSSHE